MNFFPLDMDTMLTYEHGHLPSASGAWTWTRTCKWRDGDFRIVGLDRLRFCSNLAVCLCAAAVVHLSHLSCCYTVIHCCVGSVHEFHVCVRVCLPCVTKTAVIVCSGSLCTLVSWLQERWNMHYTELTFYNSVHENTHSCHGEQNRQKSRRRSHTLCHTRHN